MKTLFRFRRNVERCGESRFMQHPVLRSFFIIRLGVTETPSYIYIYCINYSTLLQKDLHYKSVRIRWKIELTNIMEYMSVHNRIIIRGSREIIQKCRPVLGLRKNIYTKSENINTFVSDWFGNSKPAVKKIAKTLSKYARRGIIYNRTNNDKAFRDLPIDGPVLRNPSCNVDRDNEQWTRNKGSVRTPRKFENAKWRAWEVARYKLIHCAECKYDGTLIA